MTTTPLHLHWVSWEQHGDADNDPDPRPTAWPPPVEVLAFWMSGGGGEGVRAYSTVVALVQAPSKKAVVASIKGGWSPGIGAWRFNRVYMSDRPPGDRFPPPRWSIELGRWPWKLPA